VDFDSPIRSRISSSGFNQYDMKEFKGTPGKWLAKLENGRNAHDIIVDREDYAWVASVHQQFHDVATVEQAEANAKLIAAAPELLELAFKFRSDLINMLHQSPARDNRIAQIDEVINKAIS